MALAIADSFGLLSKKPIESRNQFATLSDMTSLADTSIDEGHIAYVIETGRHYTFNSANTIDAQTGKWREFSGRFRIQDLTQEDILELKRLLGNFVIDDDGGEILYDTFEFRVINSVDETSNELSNDLVIRFDGKEPEMYIKDEDGHLYLAYEDEEPPTMYINDDGELIIVYEE